MNRSQDLEPIARSICQTRGLDFHSFIDGGAFKKVFRVALPSGDSCALKIIKGPASSARTEREIDAMKRCRHPHIATLLEVGSQEFNGTHYVYMLEEFLSGGTLTEHIQQNGCLTSEQTTNLGVALIDAVHHIADMNLVHRDIKPDNIMFRADARVPVLVDFGLVRDLSDTSLTASWIARGPGTPYFAAPEQLNNQKLLIDWRTDQFCLGVCLCFAHLNVHPYQHPGEPSFSPSTVDRVAARGAPHQSMIQHIENSSFPCLKTMTAIWPVERFRTPSSLKVAWQNGRSI